MNSVGTDRRDFVKTLAAAGLAIAYPGALRTTHSARLAKVGIQLYTVRDQMKADFEGTLAQCRTDRLQGGSSSRDTSIIHRPTSRRSSIDTDSRHPRPHIAFENADQWKTALDAAKAIGHEYIVMPWIPAERRKTLDDWKSVAQVFNRAGRWRTMRASSSPITTTISNSPKLEGQVPYDLLLQSTDPKARATGDRSLLDHQGGAGSA